PGLDQDAPAALGAPADPRHVDGRRPATETSRTATTHRTAGRRVPVKTLMHQDKRERPPMSGLTSSAGSEERASEQRRREDIGPEAAHRASEERASAKNPTGRRTPPRRRPVRPGSAPPRW